jgi:hypothetical protein
MKKIKSIKQLKAEKKLMKQRQAELEDKIRADWKELKERLRPVNITKDAIESVLLKKASAVSNNVGVIKNALTYGITLLAEKLAARADEKLNKIFSKQPVAGEQQAS